MREEDRAGMGVTQQTFRQNLPYMRPSARSGSVTSVTQMVSGVPSYYLHICFILPPSQNPWCTGQSFPLA